MMKQKNTLWVALVLVSVLAIGGLVRAYSGEAPHVVVEGDYIESAGGQLGGGGGVTYNASRLVGDVYNGSSDTLMMQNGELVGPIDTTSAADFDAAVTVAGTVTLGSTSATSTLDLNLFCIEYFATSSETVLNITASSTAPTGSSPLEASYGACP